MRAFTTICCVVAFVAAGAAGFPRPPQAPAPPVISRAYALAEPGISPDGRDIAFTSGGDIWTVPIGGGEARLLVTDPATDRRPLFSPDGRHLAFVSTRTGGGDIYLLDLGGGDLRRLTFDDGLEQLDAWSGDGKWIYFSSTSHDIAAMNDVFRVAADGGTPQAVAEERYANEFGAAPSPDGKKMAFVARGIASNQWWRKGSSHIDQSELWVLDLEPSRTPDGPGVAENTPVQIIPRTARVMWPMWSAGGRNLIYVSDRGGTENFWQRPAAPGGADRRLTAFTSGRVLWPSSTRDAGVVAFERDFGIWTLDVGSGQARQVPIVRRGAPTSPSPERLRQTNQFSDLALSPDGRKIAFVARGDVFAVSARDGGDAARATSTAAIESQPVWAPDSRRLAYVRASRAGQHIYLHDFATSASSALTSGAVTDLSPVFSPDGTRIAFLRNRRELRVLDVGSKTDRVVATGVLADTIDSPKPLWSPDGRWLAVFAIGTKAFTNVELVPAEGGTLVPVSFLANTYANSMAWSADGTYLLFDTRQRTENGQLARVDLVPRTPKFREDLFRDLFNEPRRPSTVNGEPPNPRTLEPSDPRTLGPSDPRTLGPGPVFTDIRQRLSLIPTGLDVTRVTISRDGKAAAFLANAAGQANIYSYALDDLAADRPVARQLTTTAGAKADPQFTPDGRDVVFLDAGRIQIANVERRDSRALNVTAEFTVDFDSERQAVFEQAWMLLRENFFDATFRGVDWESSRERYGQFAASAGTPDELRRIVNLMTGDLNASHMGVSAQAATPVIGRLGLRFDRLEYESSGRLRVTDILPLGPAALAGEINPGDVIVAADGLAIDARTSLDELLANRIDRRVSLRVVNASGVAREVPVRPVSLATEKALLYREWVEHNREYVLKASGGRLGYVHMINMSAAALDQLHLDLDSANHKLDGVIIDLRNNTGGFVNAYALDIFTRQPYLRMSTRSVPEAPGRSVLGQRALESATTLVVNQHSLSDAEDFTEGYRTLKLGPVVGEPTAGWIIYTWDVRLVDGSTLRLPRMRVKAADGSDMEMAPRKVDVAAARPLGESAAGRDTQLDEAIKALLKKLGRAE